MIKRKKKKCLGCGSLDYIFSWGKCKGCYDKEYKKSIKKKSNYIAKKSNNPKAVEKREKKKEYSLKQTELFLEIWKKRKHNCQSCGFWLGNEPKSIFFDHLIEKSKRRDLALLKENILLVCENCHSCKTIGFPTAKHKEYIDKIEKEYGRK